MKKSLIGVALLLLVLTLVGCGGPPRVNVRGKVTYGAKTMKYGEVVFFGSDGVPKTSKIDKDGNYEITDLAGGEVKIAVRSVNPKEVPSGDRKGPNPEDVKNWFYISPAYADVNTSGLTLTVTAKDTEHNIQLTAKK